ncbi:hypothetical protein Pmani_012777 [Petrolisthes manimaculis]|uniref:Glutathione peroxidase n=1 Tax=Petrolisthes manimaculis TaxID=1843537 RepID=A0AAE1Q059_9EUCA|nr:hypothetical protein Pmani_012777 [Petrolisthes manimaculis]
MSRFISLLLIPIFLLPFSTAGDFYSFTVKDSEGQDVSLEQYRGKVTLVVNVASLCGYSDNTYKEMKKLHDILSYGDYFSVLAFPCNQFGDQEPGEMESILEHVSTLYDVEFPIFNKISVYGEHTDPAFKFLTDSASVIPDWNFYKYLVDESGQVIGAWGTRTAIQDIFDDIQAAVDKAKTVGKSDSSKQQQQMDASNDDSDVTKDEL